MGSDNVGSGLIKQAIGIRPLYPRVSGRSFEVLYRMCLTALDRDTQNQPGRHYYAGWVPLAMMLGYEAPEEGDQLPDTAKQAVKRAIRELTSAGLIKTADDDTQRDHRHRVYVITL